MQKVKKLLALSLVLLAIVVGVSVVASALNPPSWAYKKVSIKSDQSSALSGNVVGQWKYVSGENNSGSSRKLYFTPQYSDGNGWKDDADRSQLIAVGSSFDNYPTSSRQSCLWRLELNPYGVLTKGCVGTGYIWVDM